MPSLRRSSRTRRKLAIIRQNRLLVRWEKLVEREVLALHRRLARRVAVDFHYGADDVILGYIDEFQVELAQILRKRLGQVARDFGQAVLDQVEAQRKDGALHLEQKGAFDIFEESVLVWLTQHAADRAGLIAETLKSRVRKVLVETFADGQGEAATAKALREEIGGQVSLASAARIARTEAHTAANTGSDNAARATGIDMVKEWGSTEDSRTRPSHASADGQQVEMDQPFQVGSASLMYPGDPAGPAKEIINCRCVVLYRPRVGGEILS